jgi:hypothetical protein
VNPAAPDPLDGLETAGRLDADRLCGRCFHQLDGQLTRRDPRLGLTIVRCPECGLVAAVTEQPVSSRWARRFAAMGAALLMLVTVVAFLGNVAALAGVLHVVAHESAATFVTPLRAALQAETADWNPDDKGRIRFVEDAAFREAVGSDPTTLALAWNEFLFPMSLPILFGSIVGATFWTTLTLHRRIWTSLGLVLVVLGLAWTFARLPFNMEWAGRTNGIGFYHLASAAFGPTWLLRAWLVSLAVSIAAVFAARLLVPLLVRIVLPPKLVAGLASVWDVKAFRGRGGLLH